MRTASPSAHLIAPMLLGAALAGCATTRTGLSFKDLKYPISTSALRLDEMEIAYSDSGPGQAGRTLLLIHGLGSYLPAWTRNIPVLSQGSRVVAIDLPGYGKSSKGNYHYSMEFFARVVDRVIDELKLPRVTLVGHSMGGQIALTHALLFPGKAEALVLVAPAGLERFAEGEGRWLAEAVTKDAVKLTPPEGVFANLSANFLDMPRAAHFMAEDRVRVIGGPDFDAYAYAVSRSVAAMLDEPVLDRVPEIAAPTLVLFGTEDGLIPNPALHGGSTTALAKKGVEGFQRAQLVLVARAGHFVQFERPDEVNGAILRFLASPPGRAPAPQIPGDPK